ncbi:sensor histidine kinase [Fluviicola taffensis]|uniref:histidine kinase n=1 Tax=Fluviicola taffensis (strain DSM 16823 / NCIMB 13979 / RW262) TaxID=755732 RepID=F2IHT8_FLUTR|nr:sensor histidine kinase [Fluviicola taffensis]AEA45897.1 signal transduction histidine kinase [Fluviicola taffensis DSM 16823]
MKIILLLPILFVSFAYHAQVYELPATMKNAKYEDVLSYVQEQINTEKKWTKKKVSLSLFLSKWYTRDWEFDQANNIIKSIPRSKIRSNKLEGDYFLIKATLFQGEQKKAAYFYQRSIHQFENERNRKGILNANIAYAEFRRGNGQYELGLAILEQVEQALKKNPSDYLMMKVANRRAAILNEKTLLNESIESSRLCIQLAKKTNDIYYEAISYKELGACYRSMSYNNHAMLDSSRLNYQLSEKRFRDIGLIKEAIQAKEVWITTDINNSDHKSVINGYKEIENEIKSNRLNYPLKDIYLKISSIYLAIEDYENAFKYKELYSQENERSIYEKKESELKKVKGEFVALILQSENDKIKQDNKLKQSALKEEQKRSSRYIIVVIVLVILLTTVIVLLSRNRKLTNHLTVQNKEKDFLIQEVHHRVKNNLQFVKSILLLQSTKQGQKDEQILNDISRRIDAMSLVHEMLYTNNESNQIFVKNYLEKLIQHSDELFSSKKKVKINLEVADIQLPIEKMVSIGIICSELLTNSIKHAFHEVENPEFTIQLKIEQNSCVFSVNDNGSIKNQEKQSEGLGMQLIDIFSRQLKGDYVLTKKNGYYYNLKFNI